MDGWRESRDRPFSNERRNEAGFSEHNLDRVAFSVGPPEEQALLVPDAESKPAAGKSMMTWKFSGSEKIWFSCGYRETSIILSRPVEAGLKQCVVVYDKNAGIAAKGARCN